MSFIPAVTATGAARAPLPYGLFSVVALRDGEGTYWEGGGVQFDELGCAPAARVLGNLTSAEDGGVTASGLPKEFEAPRDAGTADAFTVYGSAKANPIGGVDPQALASARLTVGEEAAAERFLWTGDGSAQSPAPLASAAVVETTADLRRAVARLEQEIAKGYGSQGVIHMSRLNALLAIERGVVEAKSSRLQTKLGTPVVAGTGYEDDRIVATPAMFGLRSEVFNSSSQGLDLLDRSDNTHYAVAERRYLIGFDSCGPWAVTLSA